jgi:hypothetical protein
MKNAKDSPPQAAGATKTAYVYQIRVDGVVRYVGKGRNGRVYAHLIDAQRTATRPGVKIRNVWPFFRQQLVRAVRRRATIQEKILVSNLTDTEAYRIEGQMIGKFHKRRSGQLWNTIDERFMDPQYLPKTWSNPVHPAYKVPRPLGPRDGPLFAGQVSIERQREINQRQRDQRLWT